MPEQPSTASITFGVLHLFCGVGGGALGFQGASSEWRGIQGNFRTLGGVDVDPDACADFGALTGVPATCLDLFSRADYVAFHGHEPPAGWREATGANLRAATGGQRPDVVFGSPPCKGMSSLLPSAAAASGKYQALNRLVVRGVQLTLEAWPDDPPGLLILENVPRITTRGAGLLREVKSILRRAGYDVQDDSHDVGEIGGLAQHRRRYLLVARHAAKVPSFLYQPPKRRVRAIGEVIGPLPMPDDPAGGPMHGLPRLSWLTWLRLALIPAGGDWRDLQGAAPGTYAIEPIQGCPHFNHVLRVVGWDQAAGAVTGGTGPWQGAANVADVRLGCEHRPGAWGVQPWTEPSHAVTGAPRPGGSNMPAAVADPRAGWGGLQGVQPWDEPAATVTGTMRCGSGNTPAAVADHRPLDPQAADPRIPERPTRRAGDLPVRGWDDPALTVTGEDTPGSGAQSVADPRLSSAEGRHLGKFRVEEWAAPGHTVTGSDRVGSGAPCLADPRLPEAEGRHSTKYSVQPWDAAARTVTGSTDVQEGAPNLADPRLHCQPHNGAYGVLGWGEPSGAVTGAGDVHAQGAAAVADPRPPADPPAPLPADTDRGVWRILAADGTWHRPLTTYELAILQGFPTHMPDGSPLTLAGRSQARWRERIGNAVPPPAAEAIGRLMLLALLPSVVAESDAAGAGIGAGAIFGTRIWVRSLRAVARRIIAAAERESA